jgi:putative phosphoesterase
MPRPLFLYYSAMIIGIIADIHGNLPALTATLAEMPETDSLILAGDIAGRAHELVEILSIIDERDIIFVQGNHEEAAVNYYSLFGGDHALSSAIKRIKETPHRLDMVIDGKKVLLAHGSPANPKNEYIYPEYSDFDSFPGLGFDYIILGHTHVPMVIRARNVTVINPGSVGEPEAKDPRPSYCLLDTKTGEARIRYITTYVEKKRLKYITPFRWSRYTVGAARPA